MIEGDSPRDRAEDYYTRFHGGRRPRRAATVRVPSAPITLAELGELEAVVYRANKGEGGTYSYEHMFGEEGGRRPILAADVETDTLHVVGGDYAIEDRGIVD